MKTTRCSNCHAPAQMGDDRCRACGGELVHEWGAPPAAAGSGQAPPAAPYGAQQPPWGQTPPAAWQGAPAPGPWGAPPAGHPQGGQPPGAYGPPQHGAYPPPQHGAYPPPQHAGPWGPPAGYPMAPWQGGPPMPPQQQWPVPRGAVIALGVIGDLLITLILWAVWREKYPLAARTLVNTFAIKVGVVFGATFLFLLLAAL